MGLCPINMCNFRGRRAALRSSAVRDAVAVLVLVLTAGLLTAAPAYAVPGDKILGHRCRTYDNSVTKENTIAAMLDTRDINGAWCEIDVWKISDGTTIVWHDNTWGRAADHDTLPPGVRPTDPVKKATWAQVSQIRTKGGAPVPTFRQMIDASARNGVPLVVEIRNSLPDPGALLSYAKQRLATVKYYQLPTSSNCTTGQLDRLRAANNGAVIGIKMPGDASPCKMTPTRLQEKGASFISESAGKITATLVTDLRTRGVVVYARGAGRYTAKALLEKGVARLLVNRPRDAVRWPS